MAVLEEGFEDATAIIFYRQSSGKGSGRQTAWRD